MTHGAQTAAGVQFGAVVASLRALQTPQYEPVWQRMWEILGDCKYLWAGVLLPLLRIAMSNLHVKKSLSGCFFFCSFWFLPLAPLTVNLSPFCFHSAPPLPIPFPPLICPHPTCRLAVIFSQSPTDDISLLLRRWKVELMGFQMLYCECILSRGERYHQIWLHRTAGE